MAREARGQQGLLSLRNIHRAKGDCMKYLIKNKDGSVHIMTSTSSDVTPEREILKWTQDHQENVESHRPIDESELPEDRYFRDAWMHSEDKVNVDMEKSRDVHRKVLRGLRKPLLEALDVEFIRAVEQFDDEEQALIRIKKQELRDITQHPGIVDAKTPEELKSFMPEMLK